MVGCRTVQEAPAALPDPLGLRPSLSFRARPAAFALHSRAWGEKGFIPPLRSRSGASLGAARLTGVFYRLFVGGLDSRRCRAARGPYFASRNTSVRSAALTRGRHFLKLSSLRAARFAPRSKSCLLLANGLGGALSRPSNAPLRSAEGLLERSACAPLRRSLELSSSWHHTVMSKPSTPTLLPILNLVANRCCRRGRGESNPHQIDRGNTGSSCGESNPHKKAG